MTLVARIYLFLLIIITQSCTISAQSTENFLRNQIKFTPTKLIDFVNPGFEFGFERFHSKKTSTQLSITYHTKLINISTYHNFNGWKYSLEQKFFGGLKNNKVNYLGFELTYSNVDYDEIGEFETDTTQAATKYEDSFHIAKQSFSANFKLGTEIYYGSFGLEVNFGIGMKYKMVEHTGKQDPSDFQMHPVDPNVFHIANKAGNYFGINFPISVKVGYRF